MRICLVGPIGTADVAHLLDGGGQGLPPGYRGAPLMAVLIDQLVRLGHQVVGVTLDSTLPLQTEARMVVRGDSFELHLCPERPRAWRFNGAKPGRAVDFWRWERQLLCDALRECDADVVHAHWTYEFAMAALDSGLPTLVTCHDSPSTVLRLTRSPYRAVRYLLARQVLQRAVALTTVSGYLAQDLMQFSGRHMAVVPNPVSSLALQLSRPRVRGASRRIAMVCNGWSSLKNPQSAVRAFSVFRAKVPHAELHCFGADFGPGQAAAHWAQTNRLADGVHFRGALPHSELLAQLAGMDALLHPSLEESFGVVVAEAMALGLPVVAGSRSGGVGWVVQGDRVIDAAEAPGILVDVMSPSAVASALLDCFDDRYAARSLAGTVSARDRFSPEVVAKAYLEHYRATLAPHGSRFFAEALGPDSGVVS